MHEPQEPTLNEHGREVHPAFGMISASRVSGQAVLFDSDITHQHFVMLRIEGASRKRDIKHDWIHGDSKRLIEVEMSEAQWASFVSFMNTSGVPCTLRGVPGDFDLPGLPFAPRLAVSMQETHDAAVEAFTEIQTAFEAYKAKPTKDGLHDLEWKIKNAVPNVDYAVKTLGAHAENVVQKARADIEAMVTAKAAQLGIEAGDTGLLGLGKGVDA